MESSAWQQHIVFYKNVLRILLWVLEKESHPGQHQSTHNSGVLHAGLYYKPGSLKARLAVNGYPSNRGFLPTSRHCARDLRQAGSWQQRPAREARLPQLRDQAMANGLSGVRLLDRGEMAKMESHVGGSAALHVPEEGIVDYAHVCRQLVQEIENWGGRVKFQSRVHQILPTGSGWILHTASEEIVADHLVNCGGLYSDRIAPPCGGEASGEDHPISRGILPATIGSGTLGQASHLSCAGSAVPIFGVCILRALFTEGLRPAPTPFLPGHGKVMENMISISAIWQMLLVTRDYGDFWGVTGVCAGRKCSGLGASNSFALHFRGLVPDLNLEDLEPGGAGVRAQAMQHQANSSRISRSSKALGRFMWLMPPPPPPPPPWLSVLKLFPLLKQDSILINRPIAANDRALIFTPQVES